MRTPGSCFGLAWRSFVFGQATPLAPLPLTMAGTFLPWLCGDSRSTCAQFFMHSGRVALGACANFSRGAAKQDLKPGILLCLQSHRTAVCRYIRRQLASLMFESGNASIRSNLYIWASAVQLGFCLPSPSPGLRDGFSSSSIRPQASLAVLPRDALPMPRSEVKSAATAHRQTWVAREPTTAGSLIQVVGLLALSCSQCSDPTRGPRDLR